MAGGKRVFSKKLYKKTQEGIIALFCLEVDGYFLNNQHLFVGYFTFSQKRNTIREYNLISLT